MISMAVHRNLLHLKGFCMTPTERLLVYPFVVNGSVASWLRGMVFGCSSLLTGQRASDLARLANDDDAMLFDWVKRLLTEKKLETLVDVDLKGNYIDVEVERLIQVALLCTQRMPLERPKMSEVVRMLEGNGLAER
ncbi:hypothetical protein L1987_85459 [Smallanthus sonchifolius]|uniref:Uncharacterized protein n=1 Tax=Smallanthus sonchifolius TaxID=185202 RepID=A0ACB8XWK9_9ASTR|nr:hypothetical protein L1987_85459 [Smallanthus sonchifolius]